MIASYRWLLRQWVNHPLLDLTAAVLAFCGLWATTSDVGLLRDLAPDARRAVYQTAATLSGTLLGLVLTSISILNTLLRADLDELTGGRMKAKTQRRAGSLFFSAVRALGAALLIFIALLIVDTSATTVVQPSGGSATAVAVLPGSGVAQAVALAAVIALVSRIGRVVWVLSRLLDVSAGIRSTPAPTPINEQDEAPQ